jgi:hypothetical protein
MSYLSSTFFFEHMTVCNDSNYSKISVSEEVPKEVKISSLFQKK